MSDHAPAPQRADSSGFGSTPNCNSLNSTALPSNRLYATRTSVFSFAPLTATAPVTYGASSGPSGSVWKRSARRRRPR